MTINRDVFFASIRDEPPFTGSLKQAQVDGLNYILDAWEARYPDGDIRWLANMLGQSAHETGARMQPVREGFATTDAEARRVVRNREYGRVVNGHVYYGRGLIQLTWYQNYVNMGRRLGVDLANQPDLALDPRISADIMMDGMINGIFTGKGLGDYLNEFVDNPLEARRIVNGMDQAPLILGYHTTFLRALEAATTPLDAAAPPMPKPMDDAPMGRTSTPMYPEDRKPAYASKTNIANVATSIGGTAVTVGSAARAVDPNGSFATFLTTHPEIFVLFGLVIVVGAGFLSWKWLDGRAKQIRD